MREDKDKITRLYDTFVADGYDMESEDDFRKNMSDAKKRKAAYDALVNDGYEMEPFGEFENNIGYGSPEHSSESAPVPASSRPDRPQGWNPTEQEKRAMRHDLSQMAQRSKQMTDAFHERMGNMREYGMGLGMETKEGRKVYNPESGKFEQTYLTPAGNRYNSKALADAEQRQIKDAMERELHPVESELRDAYAERDRLNKLANERIDELERDYKERPWWTKLGEYANSDKMPDAGSPHLRWGKDTQYTQYMAALRKNQELITMLEDARDKRTNEFWHSLGKEITNGYTFSLAGKSRLDDVASLAFAQRHINTINKKRQKGEPLTKEEQAAEAVLKNAEWDNRVQGQYGDQYGAWARAGKMGAVSADLMTDFLLMGGQPLSLAKNVAGGVGKVGTRLFGEAATKGFGKFMVKATGATVGSMVAGAEIANTIGIGRTMADAAGRYMGDVVQDEDGNFVFGHFEDDGQGGLKLVEGGDSFLGAVLGAERSAIAENGSEIAGEFLPGSKFLLKGMEKISLSKIASYLTSLGGKQWYKAYSKSLEAMGFHGVPGEALEEYVGTGFDALMGGDEWKNLADKRTHIDIWLGCATMGALLNAPRAIGTGTQMAQYYRYKHNADKASARASIQFGTDTWEPLREKIDGATNEQITDVLLGVLDDESLNDEQKNAVANYAGNLQRMRGYSLGRVSTEGRTEETAHSAQQEADDHTLNRSYAEGYSLETAQEMNDARNMLDYQRQRMIEVVGANEESLEDGVIDWLNEAGNAPAGSERRQTILDYLNAKATYDGMIQRVRDDIDGSIEQSDAMIDSRTNRTTGMIQGATMKQDDRKIYVVYGNIMPYADRTGVDIHASDGSIIVRDAETGTLEQVSPDAVLSVEEAQDPSEQKRLAADAIRLQLAQEAAGKIDGIVSFNPGDTYTLESEDGEQMQIQVTANGEGIVDNGDGTVNVTDGASIFQVTKDVIQQAADAANLARVEEFEKQRAAEEMARKQAAEEAAKPQYAMNDLITLRDGNGNSVRGSITADADADGRYEVYTEDAVNGKRVNLFTRDELDNMIVEHNGEIIEQLQPDGTYQTMRRNETDVDENGNAFVKSDDGTTIFGEITEDTGLSSAPIKLSEGTVDEDGNGYGLQHIEARHGEQIRKAGFASVEDFVKYVAANYDKNNIKVGKRRVNGSGTFIIQKEDEHSNLLYIELSHDGSYWNVNSGGVFRKGYTKKKENVEPASELPASDTAPSDKSFVQTDLEDGSKPADTHSDNQRYSFRKVTNSASEKQENGTRNGVTALERIPKDEQGNPVYEQAETPDLAWDAIVEQTGGNEEMAQTVADGMVADKEAALKKIEKAKPKGGRTVEEKIAAEKERKAAVDAAKQELDIWQKIAQTTKRRKIAAESERRRIAAEQAAIQRAEEEKLRAEREEAERKEREALNGVPDMVDDTPQDARARGYRRVNGHKYDRQAPVPGLQGKKVSVKFGDGIIPTGNIAVIESRRLQPSHIAGQRNPLHFIDEAQPKERNDEASVLSAEKIAGNIRPEEITSSVTAFTGAPTVNARGEAIQGNNRSGALRRMWESHPDQAAKYKQYLKDHADEFGLDADDIEAMERPVLVNMLDVEDSDAITLGQYVAQDTESGGTERIKPKNAVQKMGADMRTFANLLLSSSDDETSFAGLVDNNGGEVLAWMNRKGYITPTQYKSAFDSKGNLTAEAKNDLKGIMYQSIFQNGNTRLEEMFNAMPAKAQRAILATAYRDYDSPNAERMVEEIQNSIRAYNALSQDEAFVSAKNWKEARMAVEAWKRQYAMDDVTGESYLPADKFSNFALHLATMYKGESQSLIQGTFNQLYDLIQGTQEETLFEKPDNTPRTLIQAIKETLNIDYNGQQRSNVLAGGSAAGQEREQGSAGASATGERVEGGKRTTDSGGDVERDSGGSGSNRDGGEGETAASQTKLSKEEAADIIAKMEERAEVAPKIELTIENWDAEFGEYGIVNTPIGNVKMGENQFTKLMRQGRNGKLGMIKPTLENPDIIIEDNSEAKEPASTERKSSYVYVKTFVKSDGSRYYYFTSVTVSKEGHEVVISNQEKRRNVLTNLLLKGKLVWKHADDVSTASDVADGLYSSQGNLSDPTTEGTDAPQTNTSNESRYQTAASQPHGPTSESKSNTFPTDKQTDGTESKPSLQELRSKYPDRVLGEQHEDGSVSFHNEDAMVVSRLLHRDFYGTELTLPIEEADKALQKLIAHGFKAAIYGEEYNPKAAVTGTEVQISSHEIDKLRKDQGRSHETINGLNKRPLLWERGAKDVSSSTDAASASVSTGKSPLSGEQSGSASHQSKGLLKDKEATSESKGSEKTRISNELGEKIAKAEAEVNTEPTPAQAEAGNYKKGHVTIGEFDITIENPAGSTRKGVDADGKEWSTTMANTYGYIKGTEGVDGDHIDVFLSNDIDGWNGRKAFVVDQTNTDGSFDEHKVMLGFNDKDEAMKAYLANYDATWEKTHPGLRISETDMEDFNKWVQSSHRKTKPFADYSTVRKVTADAPARVADGGDEAYKLPGRLSKSYEEGNENAIKEAENALREHIKNNITGGRSVFVTYLRAKDNTRKKEMPESRKKANRFIAEECKSAMVAAGFPVTMFGNARSRMSLALTTDNQEVLDVLAVDDEFNVRSAVVHNPNASDELLGYFIKAYDNNSFDAVAKEILAGRRGNVQLRVGDEMADEMTPSKRVAYNVVRVMLEDAGVPVEVLTDGQMEELAGRNKKAALETDSVLHGEHQRTVISSADGAKVLKNLESLAKKYDESEKTEDKTFIGQVANALGSKDKGKSSQYVTFETKNGKIVTIRLSDHNATVSNYDNLKEKDGISIVISPKKNKGMTNDGDAHIVEFYYDAIKLRKAENKPLAEIVRSIQQTLYSGEYKDTTGLAQREEVNIAEHIQFLKDGKGVVYGAVTGGKIYLNGEHLNPETPLHEYTHLWDEMVRRENPELWKRGVELMKQTPLWDKVLNDPNYADIRDDEDAVASEVHSRLSGKDGAKLLEEMVDKAKKEGAFATAEAVTLKERIKTWLRDMLAHLKGTFEKWTKKDLSGLTVEEFAQMPLKDLAEGVNPNANGGDGTRFGLSKPVEQSGNLVALHNIDEPKLRQALELGGFPMPSIAITRSDVGHTSFGDISLIFGKDSIDPTDRRNKVYGEDAWTPTFPQIGYKLNSGKTSDIYRRANDVQSGLPLFNPSDFHPTNYEHHLEGFDSGSLVNHFKDDYGAKQFYLSERGNAVEKYAQHEAEKYNAIETGLFRKLLDEIGLERLKNNSAEKLETELKQIIGQYLKLDFDSMKPFHVKAKISNTRRKAIDYAENGNTEVRNDIEATKQEIDKRTENGDFEEWLREMFSGIVEKRGIRNNKDWYTPSGTSRKWEQLYDEITLDNVVRQMQSQAAKGGSGLFNGSIFGAAQAEYKTVDDIRRAAQERINAATGEEIEQQRSAITDRLSKIAIPGVDTSKFTDMADMSDNIQDAVAKSHTAKGIYKYLKDVYPGMTMEIAKEIEGIVGDIQKMSARYFEAKPYRAVGFDEVRAAIVPSGTDAGIIRELEDRGIEVRTYQKGDTGQRRQLVAETARGNNLLFHKRLRDDAATSGNMEVDMEDVNRKFNEELETLTPENADRIILSLGRPSEVLRAGGVQDKPMKLYGNKVIKKMKKHGFKLPELRNLPEAVANPIAVFNNYQKEGNRSVLTELQTEQGNFLVTLSVGKDADIDFNIVSSVFGKGNNNITDWINDGFLTYINKEKAHEFLSHQSAPIAATAANSELSSATKVVENFENPALSDENLYRRVGNAQTISPRQLRKQMAERVKELADTLHLDNVDVVTSVSGLKDGKKRAKGFYTKSTGKITIVIPNHTGLADVEQTLLHEAVAHYGLRQLFGEHFDTFLDNVLNNADESIRRRIVDMATKNGWDFRKATEEYLAGLAERTNFEEAQKTGWWQRIKRFFSDMLDKLGFPNLKGVTLSDNELRYILWRSYENLKDGNRNSLFKEAADIAMQYELGVGEYADSPRAVNERFNEELKRYEKGEMDKNEMLHLGMPNGVMRQFLPDLPIVIRQRILKKGSVKKHNIDVTALANMPQHLSSPIFVFQRSDNTLGVLTEMQDRNGKNVCVAIELNRKIQNGGEILEVNDIRSVHGRNVADIVYPIVQNGTLKWADKGKGLAYLSSASRYVQQEIDKQDLSTAAKIVENFENPKIGDGNPNLRGVNPGDNERFNEELKRYEKGEMDKNEMFHLGMPNGVMRMFLPDLPIVMRPRIINKASNTKHNVDISSIENLPKMISSPIFVFNRSDNKLGILTDAKDRDGLNICVAIELNRTIQDGGEMLEVNDVRSVHGRDEANIIKPIAHNNTLVYADKKKGLAYLSSASSNYQQEIDKQDLSTATKIVENFENPKIGDGNDVLFRDGAPVMYERQLARDRYDKRMKSGTYQSREALQDSLLSVKEAMLMIDKRHKHIEDVEGFENAYLGENRLSSVNQAEADAFAHLLFKPMLEEVARLARNEAEREELTDYMMAKHGLERNRVMAERDAQKDFEEHQKKHPQSKKTLQDFIGEYRKRDYAGLTALTGMDNVTDAEAEARAMVDEYESAHDTALLWEKVNAVSKAILSKQYECGMMSKETYENVRDMYAYYIPLRGFDEKTSGEVYAYLTHRQSAFNAPIKKSKGRKSKADDPFANLQSMAESTIMQGNRNRLVKQKFLNFVLNHPSDLVSVSDLWLEYNAVADEWRPVFPDNIDDNDTPDVVEQKMKDFEDRMRQLAESAPGNYKHGKDTANIPYRVVDSRDLRKHQVVVKRNGRDYVVTVNGNPRLAQALNGQTNPDNDISGVAGKITKASERVNRHLSAVYTTRNPDFVVSNFVRDMLYTNSMVWIKESPNYALRFHRNVAKANIARMKILLAKHRKGTLDMDKPIEAMFHQFMMNGGETGYTNIRDIEQHKNDIKRELKKANGKIGIRRAMDLLGERFDELNRAVENSARFAAFMTSREMGRTIDRAIYDAKEISVNFNKKGSGAKFLGENGQTRLGDTSAFLSGVGRSSYVFWNAAIQGTANFGRQMKRHPAKALTGAAAMFVLGAVIAYLGGSGDDGDDDDKNAYYNLPEHVRRSNILFRARNHWISLPLPVEYRALYGMGELMTSVISGKEHLTGGEIASAIAGQATQMLPIDFLEGGGGLNAFVPSAAKPLWEAYVAEKSWTGMPLYKDTPYNKDMPEWTKAYKSANKHIVNLAATLNEMTGGDPYTKGAIDDILNPAKVEYLLNGYFGGVFGTIDKLAKTGETILGDREYDPRNILLVNRLVKAGDERTEYRAVNNEYFRLKEEHDRVKSRLKHYENDTDNGIFDYAEKIDFLYNSPEYERYEIFEDYRRDIDGLYDELKDVADDDERKQVEAELNALKKEMIEEMEKTRKRK